MNRQNQILENTINRCREKNIILPTYKQMANPELIPGKIKAKLKGIGLWDLDPLNLFRITWKNEPVENGGGYGDVNYLELPTELTGVEARIFVLLGKYFPTGAHKVGATFGPLVEKLITGKFDPTSQKALWPSTGNYCRGGAYDSYLLGCEAIAVLPEGMSRERFEWLETVGSEIFATPGSESNVKEIYDACHELSQDPDNVILNQFSEFANYIVHRAVTGPALERIFQAVNHGGGLQARAFVAASGSAGTLAAGDHLKASLGTDTCVVEATECPTLLYNGYGEHNIQGIGDKHVPLIHNVMGSDFVIGVSDQASNELNLVFNTTAGRSYLADRRGLGQEALSGLGDLGLSSIANVLGAIKYAKYMGLGSGDVVLTVATDGAAMYQTELGLAESRNHSGGFDAIAAAEVFGRDMLGCATDHTIELNRQDRERIFNLGYYTWVEQQGVALADFDARRDQAYWDQMMDLVPVWDDLIDTFNQA